MNEGLCLRTLASIMEWTDDHAREEYQWLRLMSRFKYDGYRDFVAGVRFLECLITWLTQFKTSKQREVAYDFVRQRLVYVGPAELNKLIELCYFEIVKPKIAKAAAREIGIEQYHLWAHQDGPTKYADSLRHVLFMGLSDGARVDLLRYAARGDLINEQVVGFTQIDSDKWMDLLTDLRNDTNRDDARFRYLFVLDDFTASGTSLLRKTRGEWKGKLVRLWNSLERTKEENPLEEGWKLYVHHYLATPDAVSVLKKRQDEIASEREEHWFQNVEFTFSTILNDSIKMTSATDSEFLDLADKYYDPNIEPKNHLEESGIGNLKRGYAACSLPPHT